MCVCTFQINLQALSFSYIEDTKHVFSDLEETCMYMITGMRDIKIFWILFAI